MTEDERHQKEVEEKLFHLDEIQSGRFDRESILQRYRQEQELKERIIMGDIGNLTKIDEQ
jgi:hypothetical protein